MLIKDKIKIIAVNKCFRISAATRAKAIANYNRGRDLSRVHGVYVWAVLQAVKGPSLLSNYKTQHPHMSAIKKQAA